MMEDHRRKADVVRAAENRLDSRSAQVGVQQHDFPSRLGDGHGQIGGQRGFAVAAVGTRDLNDFLLPGPAAGGNWHVDYQFASTPTLTPCANRPPSALMAVPLVGVLVKSSWLGANATPSIHSRL